MNINWIATIAIVVFEAAICLILRYLILKRPVSKSTSLWMTILVFGITWIITYILFDVSLKSQGFINILLNCYILSRGYDDYMSEIDDEPSIINTKRLDLAFLRTKDYVEGVYDSAEEKELKNIVCNVYNSLLFCLAYAIFHANKTQKIKIQELKELLLSKTGNVGLNAQYEKVNQEMIAFKKEQIDPCYIKDNSKENYNRLLEIYLKQLCDISEIEWYDGIVEDFKHCMDE